MVPWRVDPSAIALALRAAGYDVDPPDLRHSHAPRLVARRERADETRLVTLDPGGRLRIEITRRDGERALSVREIAGLTVRPVEETVHRTTVITTLDAVPQLTAVLTAFEGATGCPLPQSG